MSKKGVPHISCLVDYISNSSRVQKLGLQRFALCQSKILQLTASHSVTMAGRLLFPIVMLFCLCCLLDISSGQRRPVARGRNVRGPQSRRANRDDQDDAAATDTGDGDNGADAIGNASGNIDSVAPSNKDDNCGPRRPLRRGRRFRPGRPWPTRNCGGRPNGVITALS